MRIPTSWQKGAIKVCLVWICIVFLTSTYQIYPSRKVYYDRVFNPASTQKKHFVETAMNTSIDDPWDYQPVTNLCESTTWREGLTFICSAPQGGVGNLRNVVVNCIRYAVEGGANLVLPRIIKRDTKNLSKLTTTDIGDFGHIFDLEHAVESLKLACPQMTVYKTMEHLRALTGRPPSSDIQYIDPRTFGGGLIYDEIIIEPQNWRKSFDTWLNASIPFTSSSEWKAWIDINTPLLQFPQSYQQDVSRSLGRVIRFPEQTRRLSATVFYEMSQTFGFHIDPTATGIPNNTFFGAHLRTASDATAENWPSYDLQSSFYLQLASDANLSVIYTSSDNPADVARFARKAWDEHQINVTSKTDFLRGDDLTALRALSWDQQGLVDYEVLLKASQLGGIVQSTFSVNLAVRRHVLSRVADCFGADGWWRDEFSQIYGSADPYHRWFEGMWA